MKDKIFGVLQRVGRSFMLPIALLPVAGLLLGIGSSFTNQTMLEAYGLTGVIHPGTIPYTVLDIMNQCGSVVFNNLALLFAMGVAIGMAKKEKEVAALSGAIAYLVMNTAISAMIGAAGGVEAMAPNTTTSMLGITTLQMGVFGGIIVGLGVAALHNRFYKTQLPQVLSFFGGTRFVPIVSTAVYLLVGIAMFYVWPVVQTGISMLGNLVISSGYAGTFIYGLIERALIPFGLHHVFYMPFWQTAVGGSAIIDGVTVQGAQNIFFAELASKTVTEFSVDATRFMAGKFPLMIFGLPGAALAMYRTARPEKRKAVAGLLLSAALTSMITGITEPLEFTFLFVAPLMYAVHCVYAGLAYMLMHILNVCVGMTFSGGLIDLTLFGILQGNDKTHWIWVVVVGAVYFVVYYLTFSAMIVRMDLKTPGREADGEEAKLYTRSDFKEKTGIGPDGAASSGGDAVSAAILRGLGGKANVSDVDCCATRLRVTVVDSAKVDDALLSAYIEHPEHVEFTESEIDEAGSLHEEITEPLRHKVRYAGRYDVAPDFTPDVPVEIVVEKPNFWKFSGDYYLQFLQNYVSGNWYKGGESNYSMLASVTLQANYNNKQEVIFENKLELKLGLQTSREDSLHGLKTSEDLIRYTGKLGLKATKNWYYTLQLIASTQFMRGYKSNDPVVYSDILSPLNLNFSLGMSYSVNALDGKLTGSIQLSPLAYNFRYVARDELATQYSLKEGHHTLNDFGSGCTFDLTWAMSELIKWKTRLYCYTTYKRTEMEWENTLTFKFNRFISTNLFIYPRFDDGSSARDNDFGYWQFKEYASIGFAYSF